eukprot:4105595-Prymnesium_polylepis.1
MSASPGASTTGVQASRSASTSPALISAAGWLPASRMTSGSIGDVFPSGESTAGARSKPLAPGGHSRTRLRPTTWTRSPWWRS